MSTFVVKKKSSKPGWKLHQQTYASGKKTEPIVPTSGYHALGFTVFMSLEEARNRAKQLNAQKKAENHKIANAARRATVIRPLIESAYLPEDMVNDFSTWLEENSSGSERHTQKLLTHWKKVQEIVAKLQLEPFFYADNSKRFYKHFAGEKYSLDYSKKLLRILNQWGQFVCKRQGRYYQKVEPPRGEMREAIDEANDDSKFCRKGGSTPLTPEMIKQLSNRLPEDQLNWVKLSLYFGLRPNEVNGLHDRKRYEIVQGKTPTLKVYQPKLKGLAKEKRWKSIPCLEKEQRELLKVIESKKFRAPLAKTMKDELDDERITRYAGRKGFTDLMLERGHSFENVSVWLGHQTIERTWRNYKDKQKTTAA